MSLCKAVIMGKVVRSPEKRFTTNNIAITTFAIDISQNAEEQTLLKVVTKGRAAERAGEIVDKGKVVILEGRLQTNVAKTSTGLEKKIVEIDAFNFEVTGSQPVQEEGAPQASSNDLQEDSVDELDDINADNLIGEDEIPF